MFVCTQLKLSERRSGQRYNSCTPGTNPVVSRACALKNITETGTRVSNVYPTPEKRSSELRVVSLNLDGQFVSETSKQIKRSPHRMPLYCVHFKRIQKMYHRDEKDLDDDFLVRGFEVRSGSAAPSQEETTNGYEDEMKCLQNGIQIQLTDCCQCVCDLFRSNFQASAEDHDFSFITMESCNSSRSLRTNEVLHTQTNNILDPNILKVIRVTMNTKK